MKSGTYHKYYSEYQAISVDIPVHFTMSQQSLECLESLLPESTTSGSLEKENSSGVKPRCRGLGRRISLIALLAVSVLLNAALITRPMYHGRCTCDQKLYSKQN